MSFNLVHILHEMGLFARLVAGTLLVMAVVSLAVFVERLWGLWRARRLSREFGALVGPLLERSDYGEVAKQAERFRASPLAQLIGAGLKVHQAALRQPGAVPPVELVKRELARRADAAVADIRRGMSVLASVGSVAPFVGLLGTVVGIIDAFQGIAQEGSGGLGAVSAGIAEALVVTAFGLLVAIPAVLAYNFLSTRADAIILAVDQSRGEFVDHLESRAAGAVASEVPSAAPARRAAAPSGVRIGEEAADAA